MKKIFIFCISLWAIAFVQMPSLWAQPHYAQVLKDVEANNPILRAARSEAEARQTAAHVGSLLPNPQVEVAYFWGDPAATGIRWDLGISQSFELPSVLVRRARLRNLQEQAAGLDYQQLRKTVLLETQQCCADIIYYKAVSYVYYQRVQNAISLSQLYQKRFEQGDCSIIDYNRAKMNLADMQNLSVNADLQRVHSLQHLNVLTNQEGYMLPLDTFPEIVSFPLFDEWYHPLEMNNPELRQLENQVETTRQQSQLSRAQWLPTVSVGYASENLVTSSFRGVKIGLDIPLWSQRNAVKAANLTHQAALQKFEGQRVVLADELRCMFHRHEALRLVTRNLETAFEQCVSIDLLDKALEAGEINLEQYLQQVEYYYSIKLRILGAKYELEQLHLQLFSAML